MKLNAIVSSLFLVLAFSTKAQISIPFTPTQDNSIYSESNNSNGQGELYAGRNCNSDLRRAFLQYDFTVIPAGSIITNVTLTLNVDSVNASAPASSVFTLHKVNTQWGEGTSNGGAQGAPAIAPDATWSDAMFGTAPWTTPGGDFVVSSSASQTLTNTLGNFTWSGGGLISDVQAWVNNPSTNKGWALLGDESVDCTARRFGSNNQGIGPNLIVEYSCPTAPTAICQDYTAYLDQSGLYVIQSSDLDGGSTSNCNAPLTFNVINPTVSCAQTPNNGKSLIISAVFDATLSGGLPKGIELYVINDISDLSVYGIGSANNGGGSDGEEFTFPNVSAVAGEYIYVASESAQFTTWFGFAPGYTSSALSINGDDAIELFKDGAVIDVFGDINTDGSGQPWEYMDGWASRNTNSNLNFGTFNIANWSFSGPNALDGQVNNTTATSPIPVASFTTPSNLGINTTLEVTDISNNLTSTCVSVITVLDTLAPTVNCLGGNPTFNLDATGNFTLQVSDINNNSVDNCGLDSLYLSQTSFNCFDGGVNTITLYGVDLSGNIDSCAMDIMIDGSGIVLIDNITPTQPLCFGSCDGSITINSTTALNYSIDGGNTTSLTSTFPNLCAGNYALYVSDNQGCIDTLSFNLTEPSEILLSLFPIETLCSNEGNQITTTVFFGTPPYLYDWDNDGTGDNDDPSDLFNIPGGNYTLVVTDANGCTASDSSNLPNGLTIDTTVVITGATITSNYPSGNFVWIDCSDNSIIPNETNFEFTPAQNGNYAAIISFNGCKDTTACHQITEVSIAENQDLIFEVYPNPTKGEITINLNSANSIIYIVDINGKTIKTLRVQKSQTVIDLSEFENGIYFIKVKTENDIITKKISLIR